jgi:hypothetical protein
VADDQEITSLALIPSVSASDATERVRSLALLPSLHAGDDTQRARSVALLPSVHAGDDTARVRSLALLPSLHAGDDTQRARSVALLVSTSMTPPIIPGTIRVRSLALLVSVHAPHPPPAPPPPPPPPPVTYGDPVELAGHRGAGIDIVPELLIREVLLYGFRELCGDAFRMDKLFHRVDDLLGGTQEEWAQDLKNALLRMAKPADRGALRIGVGYPTTAIVTPYVSIVLESGAENTAEAAVGDVLSRASHVIGTLRSDDERAARVIESTTLGVGWQSTIQIGSWSRVPEESLLLHAAVRQILFRDKGRLVAAGVHEVGFTDTGFAPSRDEYPDTGYVPVLRCSISWTLRDVRRLSPVPTRVNMRRGSFGN